MIDPRDIGAAAAVVLTSDGHDGQVYALSGPEAISYGRVAEDLSTVTGQHVEFARDHAAAFTAPVATEGHHV